MDAGIKWRSAERLIMILFNTLWKYLIVGFCVFGAIKLFCVRFHHSKLWNHAVRMMMNCWGDDHVKYSIDFKGRFVYEPIVS